MVPFPSFQQKISWADPLFLWKACESITFLGIGLFLILERDYFLTQNFGWNTVLPCFAIECIKNSGFWFCIESVSFMFWTTGIYKLKQTRNIPTFFIITNFYFHLFFPQLTWISFLLTLEIHVVIKGNKSVLKSNQIHHFINTHTPLMVWKVPFDHCFVDSDINESQSSWCKFCKSKRVCPLT